MSVMHVETFPDLSRTVRNMSGGISLKMKSPIHNGGTTRMMGKINLLLYVRMQGSDADRELSCG